MYPCIAVEHSYNCMVLLCSLFFWPSGHYTNIEMLSIKTNVIYVEQEQRDITSICDALENGLYMYSSGISSGFPSVSVYTGLILKTTEKTIRIIAYGSGSNTEKPYYKIKSGGVWGSNWAQHR